MAVFSGIKVSQRIKKEVKEIVKAEIPSFYLGEHKVIDTGGAKIWYESIGNPQNETIVLIMGFRMSALWWDNDFIMEFVNKGYHVVRLDNRGVGNSRWKNNKSTKGFDLGDMALDVVRVIDSIGKDQVNVMGISMGGMIAQTIALNYPERVKKLISLSSTGNFFDSEYKPLNLRLIINSVFLKLKYDFRKERLINQVKKRLELNVELQNDFKNFDKRTIEKITKIILFEQLEDRRSASKVELNQLMAIKKSGSRLEELKDLQHETLIIHGANDTLIPLEHAKKYAAIVPKNKFVILDNYSHIPSHEDFKTINSLVCDFIG